MKILYVNYLYDVKQSSVGAAVHVRELARALRKYNHKVRICFINRFVGEGPGEKTLREVLKIYLGRYLGAINALLSNVIYFFREWKRIHKERPDMLLVRYNFLNFSIAIVGKILRIPCILEINAPGTYEKKVFSKSVIKLTLAGWFLERLMIQYAEAVYVVSHQLKQFYVKRNIPSPKIQVIFNGADERKFNPSISAKKVRDEYSLGNKKVVGFIGSFHYWHGIDHIQSLILNILSNYNNTVFLMVGYGPLKNNLENFVEKQEIADKVFLPGYIEYDNIPFYLAAMDVVIAPYPDYTFFYYSPIKLFEYMAAGKCVIATAIGQIKEVIQDGINGMLFQPGNYDEMLEKTLLLLQNNSLRETMGKAARKTIEENYTWRHTAEKLNEIITKDMVERV